MINKKICIYGAGGLGREVFFYLTNMWSELKFQEKVYFMVNDEYYNEDKIMGVSVIPRSKFDPSLYDVVVAIGDPVIRKRLIDNLPLETTYDTIIHHSAIISNWVEIGEGSIITPGVIVTCNIKMGKHTHLNLHTTIGHDSIMGDYFTTAPGVNISGDCKIGNCVYFGTNSSVRQQVNICDNVVIGMGAVVVKDIKESGVYFGNPAKLFQ